MRLTPEDATAQADDRELRFVEETESQIGLWGPLYFIIWLNALLMAAMVMAARDPRTFSLHPYLHLALWAAGLGAAAHLACTQRIALHDLLIGLSERDRFLLTLFTLVPMALPATARGVRIIPDGLLWGAPLLLILAVTPWMTRRFLALTLLGAALAAMRLHDAIGFALAMGFGISWLLALSLTHFAHTGDPHGLCGWWPIRRAVVSALAAAIPAGAAAGLTWWAWPKPAPAPLDPRTLLPPPERPRPLDQLDPMERINLIYWGVATLMVTALILVFLHYLRRWLLRRSARATGVKLMAGQASQVEVREEEPEKARKTLLGTRGRVLSQWGRWAAALKREGLGRGPGETAAAYAERLAEEEPSLTPPAAMTTLLERAHYGEAEPQKEDIAAMERMVNAQLADMKRGAGERRRRARGAGKTS